MAGVRACFAVSGRSGSLDELLAQSTAKHPNRLAEPLAGSGGASAPLPCKGDLSDWAALMEVTEALYPVWPQTDSGGNAGEVHALR